MELYLIGTIVAAHGIRGAVSVETHTDSSARFEMQPAVLMGASPANVIPVTIENIEGNRNANRVLLTVSGCRTRNDAEALVGMNLYTPEDQLMPLPQGRYYIHDLIGCRVLNMEGMSKGMVRDVWLLPANDVYVTEFEGKDVLIPAIPFVIDSVDIPSRTIRIRELPGLYDDDDEG